MFKHLPGSGWESFYIFVFVVFGEMGLRRQAWGYVIEGLVRDWGGDGMVCR